MREWLKQRRDEINKTQDEVAKMADISRPAYNMIENGVRSPSIPVAKRVAGAMGFDWTIFFTDSGNETLPKKEAAK